MPSLLAASITMLPSGTSTFLPSISSSTMPWLDVVRHEATPVLDVMLELVADSA